MPYIEETAVHNLGAGGDDVGKGKGRRDARVDSAHDGHVPGTPPTSTLRTAPGMHPTPYRNNPGFGSARATGPPAVAKSCYAMNSGNEWIGYHSGPANLRGADRHRWPRELFSVGVSWWVSEISFPEITDGTTKTILLGEKSMDPLLYDTWYGGGDACDMYEGHDLEANRYAGIDYPLHIDTPGLTDTYGFGGPHPGGCVFALCDGSARTIAFDVDVEVYRRLAHREDGEVIDEDAL